MNYLISLFIHPDGLMGYGDIGLTDVCLLSSIMESHSTTCTRAMSLSGNRDTVTQGNPQTLL